ncbi:bifunctional 3,4-dihydroxy-2-butanone-4-phosphate synthase/GTP cyclohydrolase II [Amycolatopsis jejuensis]|uniref:bifunctional 3,4-dihydroxy-2-butanone-4-phosphate synthase/GTP cyclohydrolase II n=1 Tax=Amycolatopsis jejuensis TaxID=330084 RepID=UPI00052716E0|nr:bifunctional 3,4-dihydroxy-2-butanone-4-phosphate synthase/GTP cyclohydrolase II [Amycolatopsis jejuensis]
MDGVTGVRAGDGVAAALEELRRGRMIVVADDEGRENEGDLIMAAEFATPEALGFMIRHTSGVVCVAITEERADELDLPLMTNAATDPRGTAFTVSVDKRAGTTTGVSGADRAATVRALVDPATEPADLTRPGHIFPLRARRGGVLQRPGHTEAAADLCRLAGLAPAGLLSELTNDDGTMMREHDLRSFAAAHGLVMITVADLVAYRRRSESLVRRESAGRVPLAGRDWCAVAYQSTPDGLEHVAFVLGDVDQRRADGSPVLVRVHSECLTGDVFGSQRCDCGEQLRASLERIAEAGRGVVVYLRGHEGRGIGLAQKLRAYALQDRGMDTVDANLALGLPVDARDYVAAAWILRDLGVREVCLLTNNPAKLSGLSGPGVEVVAQEPVPAAPTPANIAYLVAKRDRMDHTLRLSGTS